MRRSILNSLSGIALAIVAMAFVFGYLRVEAQSPVGSGFTYQGRMFDASNAPVQGTCDLALRLYDHDSGGTQIGATVAITSVAMTDGYFDVTPDFYASSFNGEARWLEIEATCPPGAGSTTFPRQAINVVPYALYALNSSGITSTVYVTSTVYYTPSYHIQGWETITGTPDTYTPTAHTQDWTTITGQPAEYTPTAHTQDWTTIFGAPGSYTPTAHTQDWTTITGAPDTYTPTAHSQDWTTITGAPGSYTPTAHTQDWTTITGQPDAYTPTYHLQGWDTITGTPASYTITAHDMITAHTYNGGAALDLFGLSAASTITRITPSNNPGATANILASNSTGGLTLAGKLSYNESDWTGGNVIYVPLNASIQAYVNAAAQGDTLILASGQYIITSTITINTQLNIVGQGNAGFLTIPATAGHGTLISSATPSIVAFQINHDNVRIAHLSINMLGGSSSIGVNVGNIPDGTGLIGIVLTNIDVIVSGSGWSQGFTVYASDIVMRNLTFYISSTNDAASGFWLWNDSNTTRDAIADVYNITGIVNGKSTSAYAYGFVAENINDANTLTINLENSSVRVLAGTPLDVAVASISTQIGSPVTNKSTINAFLCTLDGSDFDAQQNGTNVLALGGSVIVNNRVSGTVTYRATIAAGTGVFAGTLNLAMGSITDTTGAISFGDENLTTMGTIAAKPSGTAGIALDPNVATGNYTLSLSPANLTAAHRATFPNYDITIAGSASALTSGQLPYVTTGGLLEGSNNATLNSSGNSYFAGSVGVGSNPTNRLSVYGSAGSPSLSVASGIANIRGIASEVQLTVGGYAASPYAMWLQSAYVAGGTAYPISINPLGGNFGVGTTNPNTFTLQVAGNIGPDASNTYDLGSASTYWATIHYHTLTSHSLSVFSTTITLQDGRDVSCLNAIKEIKADPTKKIKGIQHMDYATLPAIALNAAPMVYRSSTMPDKNGEDGADLDMMVSLILCAEKELDSKSITLDNRMSDLEKRLTDMEQRIR